MTDLWVSTVERLVTFARENGLALELRNPEAPVYQIARLVGPGISLVIYPYRTESGGRQARARNDNSSDPTAATAMMRKLGLPVRNMDWTP